MNLFRATLTFTSLSLTLLTSGVCLAQAGPGDMPKPGSAGGGAPAAAEEAPVVAAGGPAPIIEAAGKNTALVKVNVTFQPWNYRIPWQKSSPGARRGLGVLLDGNRILVTGQIVADATYIELEQADTGRKIPAKVKAVDYEANLALLEPATAVKDFFADLTPLKVDADSRVGDKLQTWQLGRVGDLIVTPMEINKVLTSLYNVEGSMFLVYETIGIIRSEANSFTLPIIRDGKLAGLLLRYDSKNQTATILPGPIIQHFLKDNADGQYQGFPSLGVEFQITLDDQFREYLGLKKDQQGVYVSGVTKGGSAEQIGLKEEDIILEMNGFKVDSRGDYKDPKYGTLNMSHIVRGSSYVGDELKVKVLRGGKEQTLTGKLTRKNPKDFLVAPYLFDRGTNFLVMGGLIFQELSIPFLQSFGNDWETSAPLRLVHVAKHTDDYEKEGKRKIVILAAALPTRSTQGYERVGGAIVSEVNGQVINDLADLDKVFKESKESIHTIKLDDFPKLLYLDAVTAELDNQKLLNGAYRLGLLKRIE
ncbi:PDZ domain-containing protein [Verrucomicrobium sp. BvORR034]|jgi:S1-C subfamily serine protease|uniref:PDZ domain-containing protein n=1 Tax=Verrucomicrobium sp. BvORR034 TaxID=1396418 RepID=UPI0006793DE0|nr:PDZ domain-containing protein [Verrucomicrobium sp. BvORR034]